MYQLIKTPPEVGVDSGLIKRVVDGVITLIPPDPTNTDYQEYLKWLAEGNTPEPADEVTP